MARVACCLAAGVPLRSTPTRSGMAPAGQRQGSASGNEDAQETDPCALSVSGQCASLRLFTWQKTGPPAARLTCAGYQRLRLAAVCCQVAQRGRGCLLHERRLWHLQHAGKRVDGAKFGGLDFVCLCGQTGRPTGTSQNSRKRAWPCLARPAACMLEAQRAQRPRAGRSDAQQQQQGQGT